MASAVCWSQMRSGFESGWDSSFFQDSSIHLPRYSPAWTPKVAWTSKNGVGLKARISASRWARMARVGVWTRPAAVMLNPPWRELKQVRARVAFRPTSQSDSERHFAASARGFIDSPERRFFQASRIESLVIDCIQSRLVGFSMLPISMM